MSKQVNRPNEASTVSKESKCITSFRSVCMPSSNQECKVETAASNKFGHLLKPKAEAK